MSEETGEELTKLGIYWRIVQCPEKVEYGERRERRSFDNRREGHGEYKGGERRERRSFDDKREGRGDFKRGEHRNFGDRREGRDNFKSSPRKFDDNKEKTEE